MQTSDRLILLKDWREALAGFVRSDGPDLSMRQMAIMMTVYMCPAPHTVRGLAADLGISKPAVTRALDRLSAMGLLKRVQDEADKRSVLIFRTTTGAVYLNDFAEMVQSASTDAQNEAADG